MRLLSLLVVTLMVLAVTATAQMRRNVTIRLDGVDRHFIVALPSSQPPSGGYPLVFMFHGSGGDGEKFYNVSGWKETGERENFVSVFPSSFEYCITEDGQTKRTTKWNNGELREIACPGQTLHDDVAFVRTMIDTIAATIPIDRSRIYASGFSNGGVFIGKLAVEMSDVFAALAMSAGRIWSGDSGAPKRKIPIAMTIGSLDDRITEPAGITEIPANDSALIYMYKAINSVLGILELEQSYTTTETASTLTFLFSTNRPGTSGPSFSFTLFKGLTHNYPNGTNHPVTGAAAFWRFFEESTQVSDAPAERELPLRLDLSSVDR